jgi:hypothetical protein
MGLKVTNNAFGTLNAGITSSATTIVLTAGQGARFPTLSAGDYFYATLIDTSNNLEIVKVTARSTDTMTIVRGQDNTTARAYSTNDRFELRPTAALFTDVIDAANSALSTRVAKSGDTMTGNLTVPQVVTATALGFRNRIINGEFNVWQKGGSRLFPTGGAMDKYYADRWAPGQFQQSGVQLVTRTGTGPLSKYAVRVSSSSTAEAPSGTRISLGQMIEHINSADLAGQQVTMSFWIRFSGASATGYGAFNYQLSEYDSEDPAFDSTGATRTNQVQITNGSLPTSWTKYTTTITAGSGMKNLGARFIFNELANTATSGDVWYELTEVQIEAGNAATPFERRSYALERMLCQRYFQWNVRAVCFGRDSSSIVYNHVCPVEMRTTPSLALTTTSPYWENIAWSSVGSITSATVSNGHMTTIGGDILISGTFAQNPSGNFINNFGGNVIKISAEL